MPFLDELPHGDVAEGDTLAHGADAGAWAARRSTVCSGANSRATGLPCRVMVPSSPCSTRSSSAPNLFLASKAPNSRIAHSKPAYASLRPLPATFKVGRDGANYDHPPKNPEGRAGEMIWLN